MVVRRPVVVSLQPAENHFIEVCLDTDKNVWVMLHSGSRGIGNLLAQHHIEVARKLAHNRELPDPELAVFLASTPQLAAYGMICTGRRSMRGATGR